MVMRVRVREHVCWGLCSYTPFPSEPLGGWGEWLGSGCPPPVLNSPDPHPCRLCFWKTVRWTSDSGQKLQEGGLPSNTCCRRCDLEGLISLRPAAQVQVPPSSICDEPKRCVMLPDKWSCYGEATNGCLLYLLRSISLHMISLHNLKPRLPGSLFLARQQRTGGEGGEAQMEYFEVAKPQEPPSQNRHKEREKGVVEANGEVTEGETTDGEDRTSQKRWRSKVEGVSENDNSRPFTHQAIMMRWMLLM